MDIVKQIASLKAETLNRLSNGGSYDDDAYEYEYEYDPAAGSTGTHNKYLLDKEQLDLIKCDAMETTLALSRARLTNRDFETTLMEVQFEVGIQLAKILAHTIHPSFSATNAVKIEEEGQVCGICQEDMVKGEEVRAMSYCKHKFHAFCIFQWVQRKTNCPLCRSHLHTTNYYDFLTSN